MTDALHTPAAVTLTSFRDAMARLGAAVHVVTSDGPGGRAGFTATAVCSVTDSPPTLIVCLNRNASAYPAVVANGVLCVNTLAGGQAGISNTFGGKTPMAERFAAGTWSTLETGAPVLEGAIAHFDCQITERTAVGTHDVLLCQVVAIHSDTAAPGLLYLDRAYHALHGG
ncbi:flavin reductase [Pseudomonas sp. NPDC007930]|uniref:flavin reductase n=1 Tax=Pseudomonas sp. NPDC007930 TaxID=3364417 RepID=UPI0036F0DFFC